MSETIETPPAGMFQDIKALGWMLYHRARSDISAIYKGGWRPLLGFTGVYIAHFAYVSAPMKGLVIDYTSVNVFLGMVFIQALGRGVEKIMADRVPAAG